MVSTKSSRTKLNAPPRRLLPPRVGSGRRDGELARRRRVGRGGGVMSSSSLNEKVSTDTLTPALTGLTGTDQDPVKPRMSITLERTHSHTCARIAPLRAQGGPACRHAPRAHFVAMLTALVISLARAQQRSSFSRCRNTAQSKHGRQDQLLLQANCGGSVAREHRTSSRKP